MSDSGQQNNMEHTNDFRIHNNNNSDRPPIKHADEEKPDPFDPFKTAYMADGGSIVQDPIEQKFTSQLNKTITPETPSIPSNNNSQPTTERTTQTSQNIEDNTGVGVDKSHKQTPKTGLVKQVSTFLSTIEESWEYHIQTDTDTTILSHYGLEDNEIKFSIQPAHNKFTVSQYDTETNPITQPREITTSTFETALGTLVEGIDWGVISTRSTQPLIWTYTGFNAEEKDFEEYISGSNNIECGGHEFVNTAAEYRISIQSYKDHRSEYDTGTLSILTISRTRHDAENRLIYRNRFAGQKQAFDFMFSALSNGLSRTIALTDKKHGNTNAIPSIEFLTHHN